MTASPEGRKHETTQLGLGPSDHDSPGVGPARVAQLKAMWQADTLEAMLDFKLAHWAETGEWM